MELHTRQTLGEDRAILPVVPAVADANRRAVFEMQFSANGAGDGGVVHVRIGIGQEAWTTPPLTEPERVVLSYDSIGRAHEKRVW